MNLFDLTSFFARNFGKKFVTIWIQSFFGLDFFKFSGPLWIAVPDRELTQSIILPFPYRTTKLVGLLDQFLVCEILDYDEIKFCCQMYHKWNPNKIQWKIFARPSENSIGSANEMIPEFAFKNNLGTNLPYDIILF